MYICIVKQLKTEDTMETLVNFVQDYSLVLSYLFYSFFIMSFHLTKTKNAFVRRIQTEVENYNRLLFNDYKEKKISSQVYRDSKRNFKQELRAAKTANMIVSPVLAIPLTLTYLMKFATRT